MKISQTTLTSARTTLLLFFVSIFVHSSSHAQGVVGTINNMDLNIVTNNTTRAFVTAAGDFSVGISNTMLSSENGAIGSQNSVDANSKYNLVTGYLNSVQSSNANFSAGHNNTLSNAWASSALGSGNIVQSSKSTAIGWNNRSFDHNQYLVGAANEAHSEYSGVFGVDLVVNKRGCWYLGGRASQRLWNDLENSLAIGWDNHTAVFDNIGLTLGTAHEAGSPTTTIANDNATARLDVFAPAINDIMPSGVRFRKLPQNEGNVLVIDNNGYVYDSGVPIWELGQSQSEEKINNLQKQVDELIKIVAGLENQMESFNSQGQSNSPNTSGPLKIYPNPTAGSVTVNYFIPLGSKNAELTISNLQGQEILRKTVSGQGNCNTNLNLPSNLSNGLYYCSLSVDGKLMNTEEISYQR